MARDLITRTQLDSIANWFDCAFEIIDRLGHAAMTVLFTETVHDEDE